MFDPLAPTSSLAARLIVAAVMIGAMWVAVGWAL